MRRKTTFLILFFQRLESFCVCSVFLSSKNFVTIYRTKKDKKETEEKELFTSYSYIIIFYIYISRFTSITKVFFNQFLFVFRF